MEVYWLEQSEEDVPTADDWFSANELVRLNGMRIAKRRADWRLGRWTAKCALAIYLKLPDHPESLKEIEVRPAPSGAPEAFVSNVEAPVTVSISHRAGVAVCAVAPPGASLGCDLELIEPRSDAFIADYFTIEEHELIARACPDDRFQLVALLWSGKESALKALREGLRLDTRCLKISPIDLVPNRRSDIDGDFEDSAMQFRPSVRVCAWSPMQVSCKNGSEFQGWWQYTGNRMRTLVAAPPPTPPIFLPTLTRDVHGVSRP
jgi:4'-phosphopantetheinyl transferase